jgi:HSP20 family protein
MLALQNAMDQLFEDSFFDTPQWLNRMESELLVPMDMRETDDNLILDADLPGLKPEDVDIRVQGNTLTIEGEFKSKDEKEEDNIRFRERRYGSFRRSIELPTRIDVEHIEAEFEDGVLSVVLPKVEETKPKQIAIKTKS